MRPGFDFRGRPLPMSVERCTCGLAWEGYPNPHAITCPMHARVSKQITRDWAGRSCTTCEHRICCPEKRHCCFCGTCLCGADVDEVHSPDCSDVHPDSGWFG